MKKFGYLCLLLFSLESIAQSTVYPYSDGHLWGLTNDNLEVLVPPQFDTSVFFIGSYSYAIAIKNKKYGTITRDFKELISFSYDKIDILPGIYGSGLVKGKYILLNLDSGKVVSPDSYDSIENYCYCKEKLFAVKKGSKKIFISSLTGKQWGKNTFDQVEFSETDFGHGALVKTGGKFGLLDTKTNAWLIPAKYNQLKGTWYNGKRIFVGTENGKTAWFNRNGKPIKVAASKTDETPSGWFAVQEAEPAKPDNEGKLDLYIHNLGNNNWKLNLEIHSAGNTEVFQTFSVKGYTTVEKITYDIRDYKQPAIIKAVKDGKTGLIGLKGQILVPFEYDNIEFVDFDEHWFLKTTQNNKLGLFKMNCVEFKKPMFKKILGINYNVEGLLVEMPDGRQGYMDKESGKIYIPGVIE